MTKYSSSASASLRQKPLDFCPLLEVLSTAMTLMAIAPTVRCLAPMCSDRHMNSRRSGSRPHKSRIKALATQGIHPRDHPAGLSSGKTALGVKLCLCVSRFIEGTPRCMPDVSDMIQLMKRLRRNKMRSTLLATAVAVTLSTVAMANASREPLDAGVGNVASVPQQTGAARKLAMGPTSAPHLPGGPVTEPGVTASHCSPPSASCSKLHKNAKYRHQPASQN